MLFNSPEFVFIFLPVTLIFYFVLNNNDQTLYAKVWLFVASLFFYSWWDPIYLVVIVTSMAINYFIGKKLSKNAGKGSNKSILVIGIVANLSLLVFFKYTDFLIFNFNLITSSSISLLHIALPLGISFFTFQQIAYIVDSYHGLTEEYSFFNYGLFVTFFPQLIAGPIVHHKEMMPQFYSDKNNILNYENLAKGLYMFFMGFSKKVILADTFAIFANQGYSNTTVLSFADAWVTSLSYTCQLYFDFSGYTDMAIGAALMFNIKIPINFNSPYKAKDIQDFWRRWHITLSRFLRDYIYIPLGGNRVGEARTLTNLMLTFIIGGIWHGAGWTFVFWGFIHGFALVIHRIWKKRGYELPNWIALLITFNFVNIAWIFFRATTWTKAIDILRTMLGLNHSEDPFAVSVITNKYIIPIALIGLVLLFLKNSNERLKEFSLNTKHLIVTVVLIVLSLIYLNSVTANDFLYFDF